MNQTEKREKQQYVRRLLHILNQDPVDVSQLRALAHSGFVNNHLRRRIWPLLLGVTQGENAPDFASYIQEHKYTEQIEKDVIRSMCHLDITKKYTRAKRAEMRARLSHVMNAILCLHPDLHYIQGYHDIVSMFVLVASTEADAFAMAQRLTLQHVRDILRPDLESVMEVLSLIFPLVRRVDPQVYAFIEKSQVQAFFSLSWVLTWFAHDLNHFDDCARIFDFLLASHPFMCMYLSAALVLSRKEALFQVECEFSAVHSFFQHFPDDLNLAQLIAKAQDLYQDIPPSELFDVKQVKFKQDSPLLVNHPATLPLQVDSSRRLICVGRDGKTKAALVNRSTREKWGWTHANTNANRTRTVKMLVYYLLWHPCTCALQCLHLAIHGTPITSFSSSSSSSYSSSSRPDKAATCRDRKNGKHKGKHKGNGRGGSGKGYRTFCMDQNANKENEGQVILRDLCARTGRFRCRLMASVVIVCSGIILAVLMSRFLPANNEYVTWILGLGFNVGKNQSVK